MELLLNVIWLMVSAAPIAWWLRKHSFASGRREFCLAIAAMFCVGLLLFAPISISDDLHQDLFASEDANSAKKLVAGSAHSNAAFWRASLAFDVVPAIKGAPQLLPSYLVPFFAPFLHSSLFFRVLPSRPPPAA